MELTAKFDNKCTGEKYNHYIIANRNAPINGGIYIQKGEEIPDQLIITFKKVSSDE